ncbi:MAG: dihydropyrimidinase [Candidatus Caldarchaeum sp.]|nr:dihydropyrimidinase [Candidatus Caldarchaeum sp.]
MSKLDLAIVGGTVVGPGWVAETDVGVSDGKIAHVGSLASVSAEKTVNARGKIVIPGGIDPHTHYELYFMGAKPRETWDIGTIASAIGGTTTTIDFAPQGKGESLLDATKRQMERAAQLSVIDFTTKPIISDFSNMEMIMRSMKESVDYGVPGFKVFMIYRHQGWMADDWSLFQVMRRARELGAIVTVHAENGFIGEGLQEEFVKAGKVEPRYHGLAKPNLVENLAILTVMNIAETTGTITYIVHQSTKEGHGIVASYRMKGLPVFVETCPHYLVLTEETFDPPEKGIYYMCSPPLRKKEDVEALWRGLFENKIQTVGSDHVAFIKKQKEEFAGVFSKIPNGFPGSEVRVPIMFSEGVVKRGMSLNRFVEVVSTNVAKIFGLYPKKGVIAPGSDADLVLIDPNKEHSLNAEDLHMGTDLSVYEGMKVKGWPSMTILRGEIIVENEQFLGKPGIGKFVRAKIDQNIIMNTW